jgi:hypothetical protein
MQYPLGAGSKKKNGGIIRHDKFVTDKAPRSAIRVDAVIKV